MQNTSAIRRWADDDRVGITELGRTTLAQIRASRNSNTVSTSNQPRLKSSTFEQGGDETSNQTSRTISGIGGKSKRTDKFNATR